MPALVRLREEGVVRAIGVGMVRNEPLTRFVRESAVDVVMVAGRTTLLDDSAEEALLPTARAAGVGVIAAGVFNSGILADPEGAPYFDYHAASPELVERAREAGLAVTFQEIGERRRLRPLASLNLYRIAQEALTNTRKHAGDGVRADVRLRWLADEVELEVSDDGGTGRRLRTVPSTGMGLVGMRERVAADGGTFEASRRRGGGFVVRVRLPLGTPLDDVVAGAAARTTEADR